MPCYNPRQAIVVGVTDTGKRKIKFASFQDSKDFNSPIEKLKVPCGLCVGCRLQRSRDWAVRCLHEASVHKNNSFITLTYDDEHLPAGGELSKRDWQLFMKRFRKALGGKQVRFYMSGEYGEKFSRPHYHAIVFGFDFPDRTPLGRSRTLYTSRFLSEVWGKGHCVIGAVTMNSAAYVARYVMKKHYGPSAEAHYEFLDEFGEYRQREREFSLMSRRPGIAREWYDQFAASDVYSKDYVTVNGKEFRPPKYYDRQYELADPKEFAKLKRKRKETALELEAENTWERLKEKEQVSLLNLQKLRRSYET